MRRNIQIGEKDIELVSNLGTYHLFKALTGKDLLGLMNQMRLNRDDSTVLIDLVGDLTQELAYVMSVQANETDVNKMINRMTIPAFVEWTMRFEASDFTVTVSKEIMSLLNSSKAPSVSGKN